MTNPTTVFDRAVEQFKRDMRWSPQATETEKTLVLGNLNGFTALLNKTLLMPDGAEPCLGYRELQAENERLRALLEIEIEQLLADLPPKPSESEGEKK